MAYGHDINAIVWQIKWLSEWLTQYPNEMHLGGCILLIGLANAHPPFHLNVVTSGSKGKKRKQTKNYCSQSIFYVQSMMLHRNTCILNCSAVVPDNLANVNVSFNTSVHHQSRDPSSCHFEFASWIYTSEWFSSDKANVKLQNKGAYTSKCKTSTQQVQHWSRCDDMGTKTNRQTRWYKGEKN